MNNADLWYNRWFLDPLFRGAYPSEIQQHLSTTNVVEPQDMAAIATPLDFAGVNYFSRLVVQATPTAMTGPMTGYAHVMPVPEASYSQMGWETFATGLCDILVRVHRDYHPPAIVVTENGVAFNDAAHQQGTQIPNRRRITFLQEHIEAMQMASQLGVPMAGYCVWTLYDNFEWIHGYHQQFGLVAINLTTQQRIIKESGRWYAHFIATQTPETQ